MQAAENTRTFTALSKLAAPFCINCLSRKDNMELVFTLDATKDMDAAIREATLQWVSTFNNIPLNIVDKLYQAGDDIAEITPPGTEKSRGFLPEWNMMWSFSDTADNEWLEDEKNVTAMADCGFRIYKQKDYGYIFGADFVGYSFYEHWTPLYKARGLTWHL
jgi:hypothetical protein